MRPLLRIVASSAFALMFLATASTAGAHDEVVRIAAMSFQPGTVAGLSTNPLDPSTDHPVVWRNDGTQAHRVFEHWGQEGVTVRTGRLDPGESSGPHRFRQAASWHYICIIHTSMTGWVRVRPAVHPTGAPGDTAVTQGASDEAVVVLATDPLPDNYAMDLQQKRDDGAWQNIRRRTGARRVHVSPNGAGTYRYRARIFQLSSGSMTAWSPVSRPLTVR